MSLQIPKLDSKDSGFKIKQNQFISILIGMSLVTGLIFLSHSVSAQTKQGQLQCRSKAKDAAKITFDQTYSQCIELAKGDEIENIRKEFKVKLVKLKEMYEQKLRKVAGKLKKDPKNPTVVPALVATDKDKSSNSSNKANAGSTSLPQKTPTEVPTANPETDFTAPTPVNVNSTQAVTSTQAASAESTSNEPSIRLKESGSSNSNGDGSDSSSTPNDLPSNNNFDSSSSDNKLEVGPDSAI